MIYNRLGRCGLKVSAIALGAGNWGAGGMDARAVREMMTAAMDQGIIYFDNAESYGDGSAETVMGEALRRLNWPRLDYIVSTKFFWGLRKGPNHKNTLNRKYLLDGIASSLQRSGLDHVDIAYCHRPDPHTPIEETVWAFHNMIERGMALYWGTSEWSAQEIEAAIGVAERHHLHKPVVEQPEYNLLNRRRVDGEYKRLCRDAGIGLATWSPLAGGMLTGKYNAGLPEGSRGAAMAAVPAMGASFTDERRRLIVVKLEQIADDLGVKVAQLALAWCLLNSQVNCIITGASRVAQLLENVRALKLVARLTPDIRKTIGEAVGDYSESWVGNSPWHDDG